MIERVDRLAWLAFYPFNPYVPPSAKDKWWHYAPIMAIPAALGLVWLVIRGSNAIAAIHGHETTPDNARECSDTGHHLRISHGYLVNYESEEGRRTYVAADYAALDDLIIHLTGRSMDTFPWIDEKGRECPQSQHGAVPRGEGLVVAYPLHIYAKGAAE